MLLVPTGVVPDSTRGDLLSEVANLVEAPAVVRGTFDPAFLELPRWGKGGVGCVWVGAHCGGTGSAPCACGFVCLQNALGRLLIGECSLHRTAALYCCTVLLHCPAAGRCW